MSRRIKRRMAVGGIPHRHLLVLQDAIPPFRIELRLIHDARHAMRKGELIPYEVPVTQPGSAVHQKMSSGCRSSAYLPVM